MQLLHRHFEEAAIEVVPDVGDVPALLGAEDVARAPDLEVAHRELEPGPEVVELLDRVQPLLGDLGRNRVRAQQEVGVRLRARPPDAAAQLVEVGKPARLGAVDEDRVGRRDVEPGLDDRGRDEHLRAALDEREHRALELALPHLAVADRRTSPPARARGAFARPAGSSARGCGRRTPGRRARSRGGSRARMIAGVVLDDLRLHRRASRRRLPQRRDLADPEHRLVQRPRDRRRAERERVERLAAGGAASPCARRRTAAPRRSIRSPRSLNTTSSWSIRWVPITMSTLPSASPAIVSFCSRSVRKRESDADRHREVLHPRPERVEVLVREDGRRDEHRRLPAAHHALERGPHRELGLAVADVAAEEPVHRDPRLHVLLDGVERDELVGRLLVGKRRFERLLPRRVGRMRDARACARAPR